MTESKEKNSEIEDERLVQILNLVDERTTQLERLHEVLSDGFMCLARERYRDTTSIERLGSLVYDEREDVTANVRVNIVQDRKDNILMKLYDKENEPDFEPEQNSNQDGLRKRKGNKEEDSEQKKTVKKNVAGTKVSNSFFAMPSAEVRNATNNFQMAIEHIIGLVNVSSELDKTIK